MQLQDQLIDIARRHFQQKGYRVHSGLQFGCELVLYADSPGLVHSDFCVVVVGPGELLWVVELFFSTIVN
jgi:tRNA splicing endonuclease